MTRLILNGGLTALSLSIATGRLTAIKELTGLESLDLVIRIFYATLIIAICLFSWRIYTGCFRDGDLLE